MHLLVQGSDVKGSAGKACSVALCFPYIAEMKKTLLNSYWTLLMSDKYTAERKAMSLGLYKGSCNSIQLWGFST